MLPGAIPRVEATRSNRLFVEKAEPDAVMLNLVHARQLLKRGETARTHFPEDVDVVLTSTLNDTKLHLISWERELEIVQEFDPDFHVPADQPVYESQSSKKRKENIRDIVEGTFWLNSRTDATTIPLVKGLTEEERRISYRALGALDVDFGAFYAAQYFNAGGNYIAELEDDVREILAERDIRLLMVGLLSPAYVRRMPAGVEWVAGQTQWRKRVAPTEQSGEAVRDEWLDLRSSVTDALGE